MKKGLSFFVSVLMLITLLCACSSSSITDDPIGLATMFDEKGYSVEVSVDNEHIEEIADKLEIRSKGILSIVGVIPTDSEGYKEKEKTGIFIYCDDNDFAEKVFEDLEKFSSSEEFKEDSVRGAVERKGKLVFIGCIDAWEEIQ